MICQRLDVIGSQYCRQFLHLFARETIDDATFACMLFDKLDDLPINVIRFLPHLIV